jgi:hypothetical protein
MMKLPPANYLAATQECKHCTPRSVMSGLICSISAQILCRKSSKLLHIGTNLIQYFNDLRCEFTIFFSLSRR